MAESRNIVPHTHTLGLEFTSPSVEVLGGHYHWTMDGKMTSVVEDGPAHIHNLENQQTSPPLALEDIEDDNIPMMDEEEAARRKKKKKTKYKTSWAHNEVLVFPSGKART